jgi:CubicO group peptidase (beta-lactamase class C family)
MFARPFIAFALALICALPARAQHASLDDTLRPYLARHELPALGAAIVSRGKLVAAGAVGTRRAGADIPVTLADRFQLGADVQALTALLAGIQVEAGRLLWTSTVGDVFQELARSMNPALRRVTLEQLLSHTSGLPADDELLLNLALRAQAEPGNLDAQRYWLVREWADRPLAALPGAEAIPASMNSVIAAAMIERAAGKSWEELVAERIFDPLELRSAGLGAPASPGRVDAPLGHAAPEGRVESFLAGPNADRPAPFGPAASVHMSVTDYARWAGWLAGMARTPPVLVRPPMLEKVLGLTWRETTPAWAARKLRLLGGGSGRSVAQAWLDPASGFAMVLVTNIAGPQAERALDALGAELFAKYWKD